MGPLTGLNGVVYPSFAYQSELTMQIIFWIYKSFVSQFRRKNNSIIWACKVAETTKSSFFEKQQQQQKLNSLQNLIVLYKSYGLPKHLNLFFFLNTLEIKGI